MTEMVCIGCPMGCSLTVEQQGETITVSGNACPRGKAFAKAELTHPCRSVTTTMATSFQELPFLPVRTDGEIPKELVAEAVKALGKQKITTRVRCGEVVLRDLLCTGVSVIATASIPTMQSTQKEKL
ncbi:MAG: DUF1667 domain-containing protein [Pygmaiobacter sp.]